MTFGGAHMKKILISTSSFAEYSPEPLERLKERGFEIVTNPYKRKLSLDESLQLYTKDIYGVIAGTEEITAQVLEKAVNLKVISRCGAGVDNVDLDAARKNNISVFNTPNSPTLAVAELTVALMLNLLRKVCAMNTGLKASRWEKQMGNLLSGKKAGIIGFGRIGRTVSVILSAFNVEVAYYDVAGIRNAGNCIFKDVGSLLTWADIVTLHLAPDGKPQQIIGMQQLRSMKKGSWIINTSRGGLIDESALYECIKDGHIAGAALDVFAREPYDGPLKELDNVILTPHVGSYAREARIGMELDAVDNLIKSLTM
jgi:D-3-phosphoglycerate dehydrogenase / 2-oxoglutarate reductase